MLDFLSRLEGVFSNREIAIFFWAFAGLLWSLSIPNVRRSLRITVETFFNPQIAIPIGLLITNVGFVGYGLSVVGLWEPILLKDTIYWIFGVGIVMLLSTNDLMQTPETYFWRLLKKVASITVLIEFILNLHVFSFLVEFLTIPIVFICLTMLAYLEVEATRAEINSGYARLRRVLEGLLSTYGLLVLCYSLVRLSGNFEVLVTSEAILSVLLPIILAISVIPLLYGLALFAAYEQVYNQLNIFVDDPKVVSYAKWQVLSKYKLNLTALNEWYSNGSPQRICDKSDVDAELDN